MEGSQVLLEGQVEQLEVFRTHGESIRWMTAAMAYLRSPVALTPSNRREV